MLKSYRGFTLALAFCAGSAMAESYSEYEVTITNITPGQSFTPQLVATHPGSARLFALGAPASDALEMLAEGGDTGPLTDQIVNVAWDVTTIDGLVEPGQSSSVVVSAPASQGFLSVAAMLIPTNDTFMALNRVRLPRSGSAIHMVPAYDAGTEANDQSCQHIPGPVCDGEGYNGEPAEGDEGFIHIGNGFHELGDLDDDGFEVLGPAPYDWRNSVARITVRKLQ